MGPVVQNWISFVFVVCVVIACKASERKTLIDSTELIFDRFSGIDEETSSIEICLN